MRWGVQVGLGVSVVRCTTNWGLKQPISISHSSGGRKSRTQVSAGLVSSDASLLGLQMALCCPAAFPLCTVCVPISSYTDTRHIGRGPTCMASFYPDYLLKGLISKYYGGLGLQQDRERKNSGIRTQRQSEGQHLGSPGTFPGEACPSTSAILRVKPMCILGDLS